MNNYNEQLVCLLENAVESTFKALLEKNENFYYFALVIDERFSPYISAWSYEAFEKFIQEHKVSDVTKRLEYKWSIFESPYVRFGHELYFRDVDKFFQENDYLSSSDFGSDVLIHSMEETMKRLDKKGLFGIGYERKRILISAEMATIEWSNAEIIKRLNPRETIQQWLKVRLDPEIRLKFFT